MQSAEIKDMFDGLNRDWTEYKKVNDTRLKEIGDRKWDGDPILRDKLGKMDTTMDTIHERLQKMETATSRLGQGAGAPADVLSLEDARKQRSLLQKRMANKLMRRGSTRSDIVPITHLLSKDEKESYVKQFLLHQEYARAIEAKTMTVEVDIEGGFLVRPEVADAIQKTVYESSPMRQLANVVTIGTDAWEMPYDTSQPNFGWVGESQSRSVTTPTTFQMIRIPVHEMYAEPQVSQKLLEDAMFDVEAYHEQKVADRFARVEATAFVAGTGVFQPRGILTVPLVDGTTPLSQSASDQLFNQIEKYVSPTGTANFVADDVITLQNRLYEPFQKNASFLMHRLTASFIRKLKDSQNRYIWSSDTYPGIANGQPEYLLGRPVYFGADVPQVASSANAVIYGDFRAGYQIVDRVGISVLRDPYTTKGFILYYTRKRVGGDVVQFQAFKVLTCHS